jgi:hypothetical protein
MRVRRGGPAGSPILQPAQSWDPNLLAAPDVLAVIVLTCSALTRIRLYARLGGSAEALPAAARPLPLAFAVLRAVGGLIATFDGDTLLTNPSALSVVLLSIGVWLAVGWIAWSGQASRPSRLARAG